MLSYIACMIHASKILVIVGSTRSRRICPQVSQWIAQIGRDTFPAADIEVVDLKDWPLPADDEPGIPAGGGGYANSHTPAWSEKIAPAQAFVFVAPQYNWGYPAPLKNALDHLFNEWAGKPAMVVSYGSRGGNHCIAQLRQVIRGLDMKNIRTSPALKLSRKLMEANTGSIDAAKEFASHRDTVARAFRELDAARTGNPVKRLFNWL